MAAGGPEGPVGPPVSPAAVRALARPERATGPAGASSVG